MSISRESGPEGQARESLSERTSYAKIHRNSIINN
jgi:hypothetical protein